MTILLAAKLGQKLRIQLATLPSESTTLGQQVLALILKRQPPDKAVTTVPRFKSLVIIIIIIIVVVIIIMIMILIT